MRQVHSDLAKEFRIVTYDLRGHGNSDKPLDPARYRDSKAWGDEVQAVIDTAGLKHPVLVGWSYAGRVISDYVSTHGASKLAGINLVDAPIKADPALIGDNLKNLPPAGVGGSHDQHRGHTHLLHGCFSNSRARMIMSHAGVQHDGAAQGTRGLGGRPLDASDVMSKLKIPVLVTHGAESQRQARRRPIHRLGYPGFQAFGL